MPGSQISCSIFWWGAFVHAKRERERERTNYKNYYNTLYIAYSYFWNCRHYILHFGLFPKETKRVAKILSGRKVCSCGNLKFTKLKTSAKILTSKRFLFRTPVNLIKVEEDCAIKQHTWKAVHNCMAKIKDTADSHPSKACTDCQFWVTRHPAVILPFPRK